MSPAVLTVNSTLDTAHNTDPYLSLREAIAIVNSPTLPTGLSSQILAQISGTLHAGHSDTIRFDYFSVLSPITLDGGLQLELSLPRSTAAITIDASANFRGVTVDGHSNTEVFRVDGGVQATLASLTITGGIADGRFGVGVFGGGIYNAGTLAVTNSKFNYNHASGGNGGGGAIANATTGALTVSDSTFDGNVADSDKGGGAIYNEGSVSLSGSFFGNNRVNSSVYSGDRAGGAIYNGGGSMTVLKSTLDGNHDDNGLGGGAIYNRATLTVSNCTITANTGQNSNNGGINNAGTLTLVNTIVAQNTAPSGYPDIDGTVVGTSHHNLIGNGSGMSGISNGVNGNQVGTASSPIDPRLSAPGSYGGPTVTLAPLGGSPALNAGDPAQLWTTDQRGVLRLGGANIGAFQASAAAVQVMIPAPVTAGTPFAVTVTAVDRFSQQAYGCLGAVHFSSTDPRATLPADYTLTAADNGSHAFSGVVFRSAGSHTITVSNGGLGRMTEFAVATAGSNPLGITAGADGNLWFTEGHSNKIGKITLAGAVTEFPIPTSASVPEGITAGPDGNLWFVESSGNKVGKITPAGTVIAEYAIPTSGSTPLAITAGPDGNLWFTEYDGNKVGKITPAGAVTEVALPTGSHPYQITAGPDGNLWFTEEAGNKVGKITPAGTVTAEYAIPTGNSNPAGITAGADGNLWFTEATGNKVGRITPAGTTTEFPVPTGGSMPLGITAGADGSLWFTEEFANKVSRITPAGSVSEFPVPTGGSQSFAITAGADGNLWFVELSGNKVGRIISGTPTGSAAMSVAAAAADRYALAASAANPDVAGTPFNVTVTAQDPYGNTATSFRGTAHFSSTDPAATLPADYTFTAADNGVHTFSGVVLRTAGGQTLTAVSGPIGAVTEFAIPTAASYPEGVTAGPDGNLWFTEFSGNKVAKITPAGAVTEYTIPTANSQPQGITTGPDGNLWFVEYAGNKVGKITPGGAVIEYLIPTAGSNPQGITAGPDGNLWFTEASGNKVGRITPAGAITDYPLHSGGSVPWDITAGPDGNLWFTELLGNKVGKITPAGVITAEFPVPTTASFPFGIAAGADGNLWFTESSGTKVGKITPAGAVTEYPVPTAGSQPQGITAGPDGNLWFTESYSNQVGRITPGGAVSEYPLLTGNSQPYGITTGPDHNLWFTEYNGNKVGRITSGAPAGSATVNVVAAAASQFGVSTGAANPDVAGTSFNVTVTAQDPYGNTATGYRGTAHFTSSDPQATLPPDYTFAAGDNGVHTFSGIILRTARYPLVTSITATDTVTGSITGSAGVRVVAAPATHFVLSTSAANPDVAGTPFDVTVTAQDPYGNTDTGYLGTVHFSSADPYGASLPADFSFRNVDQGVHRFPRGATLYTAGTWDVTATDTQSSITGSANVNVIAAAASQFVVSTDAANPDIAGTVFDVTVVATDPYGNTDAHYQGTVHFSSADPYGASLPADYTFTAGDQGVHTFAGGATLYTAGTWDVTATDTNSAITGAAFVNVQAAPAVALQIVAPASATSGVAFDVTVIAVDAYGNTDMNYTGTVTFSTSDPDPGVVLPPDYTFRPSDAGMMTFAGGATLVTLGDQTLTATDTLSGITGTTTVTVTSGPDSGAGGFGGKPAVSEQSQSATVSTGPARLPAVAADAQSYPARTESVAATAHRAVLIDYVWSDPAGLLSDLWTDVLSTDGGI
jgi:streptogramin lyase